MVRAAVRKGFDLKAAFFEAQAAWEVHRKQAAEVRRAASVVAVHRDQRARQDGAAAAAAGAGAADNDVEPVDADANEEANTAARVAAIEDDGE
jgi:hypothetical protein